MEKTKNEKKEKENKRVSEEPTQNEISNLKTLSSHFWEDRVNKKDIEQLLNIIKKNNLILSFYISDSAFYDLFYIGSGEGDVVAFPRWIDCDCDEENLVAVDEIFDKYGIPYLSNDDKETARFEASWSKVLTEGRIISSTKLKIEDAELWYLPYEYKDIKIDIIDFKCYIYQHIIIFATDYDNNEIAVRERVVRLAP